MSVLADEVGVRAVRLIPPVALVAGLGLVGLQWHFVVNAYSSPNKPSADIQLNGLDLTIEPTPIEPSPFQFAPAPDTREVPIELAYGPKEEVVAAPIILGGAATLNGVATGPNGSWPFALVRLERHSDDGWAVTEVTADEFGHWSAPRLLGGRYRVRAWLAGQAAMRSSEVFFLGADEAKALVLELDGVDPQPRMRFAHRGDIELGGTGTVAVTVTTRTVDGDGVIEVSGLAGAIVGLVPTAEVTVAPGLASADGDGVARFVLTCQKLGTPTATVSHQGVAIAVDLPDCVAPPPAPTVPLSLTATATATTPAPAPATAPATAPAPAPAPGPAATGVGPAVTRRG